MSSLRLLLPTSKRLKLWQRSDSCRWFRKVGGNGDGGRGGDVLSAPPPSPLSLPSCNIWGTKASNKPSQAKSPDSPEGTENRPGLIAETFGTALSALVRVLAHLLWASER